MSLVPLHFAVHLRGLVGGAHYLNLRGCLDNHELNVPNPCTENTQSPCGHVPCHWFGFYLDPWYYVDFHYHPLHLLIVDGYWLWFSVASVLPLKAVQFALSNSQYCPYPLTELILIRFPLQVGPLLTQPYGLLSQVEDTFSSYHHTGSALELCICL